ncbi:chromosome segregation protein SMC [Clostridium putrefaciens]|uniref:Chromosome partition protein Smc n=1 Tax=Clostridium putrefaciens TaxID=99675 RepID=A0A381J7L3_9CLOT|nr:chromosome segregation protein SMC [Clostridium putrefaciens]SUY47274.1 chromosome segregation protein SMC [Clostridium putrefaciens]
MFLKSIEIKGFKSFADKIELKFKKGITGVVGPNGSGKSNISDAIRWVLGEQSVKSLRGGKMEDVIFSGTEFRKSVGLAQVSLTLDNSKGELPIEYMDVTIGRRLYRSGESEYFINNISCRLKDIHGLFMDTGIGKEGYSIIGQGKIDAILSGKAEDRRSLLEEAAGIVKFKTRRDEAQKKIDSTEQNLIRINDILITYEERLEPLRIDNEKAKEFLQLSSKLKDLEVSLIVKRIASIEKKILNQNINLDRIEKSLSELKKDENSIKEDLIKNESLLEESAIKNKHKEEEYYKLKEVIQSLQAEIGITKERLENSKMTIEVNEENIKGLDKKIEDFKKEKVENEKSLKENKDYEKRLKCEIGMLEEESNLCNSELSNFKLQVSNLRKDAIEILTSQSKLRNNKSKVEIEINSLKEKMQQLHDYCEEYNELLKINRCTGLRITSEKENLVDGTEKLEISIRDNRNKVLFVKNTLNNNEIKLRDIHKNINKLEANKNALINLESNYEGYNKSVKALMIRMKKGDIHGYVDNFWVLGDIIKTNPNYQSAIEIALGAGMSNMVTNTENEAKYLIEYLKNNNLGRATFLPLNIIQGKSIYLDKEVTSIKGYIGIASEIIDFDDKFKNAIEYILGRTIISEDMKSALAIAKRINYKNKIVTLQGEVINTGGALTGGSLYYKNTNIIGRKDEIEKLKLEILEFNKDLEKANEELERCKEEFKTLEENYIKLRENIHWNNIEVAKIDEKILVIDSEKERLTKNILTSKQEIVLIEENIDIKTKELEADIKQILSLDKKEKQCGDRISFLEKEIINKEQGSNVKKEYILDLKVKKAKVDEFIVNILKEVERVYRNLDELKSEILEKKECILLKQQTIVKSEDDIKNLTKKIVENKFIIENLDKAFQSYEIENIKIKSNITNLKSRREQFQLFIQKKEEEKNKVNINKTRIDIEKENLYVGLNNEFNISFVEALDIAKEIEDEDFAKEEVLAIKKEISKLGTINLGSIDEYKDIKEKYTFMNGQKEDLNNARIELKKVIDDMTSKMKNVFSANLKVLNENFNNTFKELFKGGNAALILGDGDELTANIDINVQPPGKKLQNINLMSGGEKVLSAIALLFAILKMKPTPFCILDEIEAALDDANVYKYAEFLKKFSYDIQFIVITHRKGTMESADMLYGVTMEEKGISKIVSVDLSK